MFERYPENSRRAIFFARVEALACGADEITTKDLFLGLTYKHYEEGSPFTMLHARREELRTLVGRSPIASMPDQREIPLTRDAKIALAYAAEEANSDKQFSLEPHHLLRGIVRTGDSTAQLLNQLGWNLETLRALSRDHRKRFPPKRPTFKRILKSLYWRFLPYRKPLIVFAIFLLAMSAIIFYLRWQQR